MDTQRTGSRVSHTIRLFYLSVGEGLEFNWLQHSNRLFNIKHFLHNNQLNLTKHAVNCGWSTQGSIYKMILK